MPASPGKNPADILALFYSFSLSSLQATITKISPVLLPFVITPGSGLTSFTTNPRCCHERGPSRVSFGCNPGFSGRLHQRAQPPRLTASYFSSERQRDSLLLLSNSIPFYPRLFSFSASPFSSFECEGGGKESKQKSAKLQEERHELGAGVAALCIKFNPLGAKGGPHVRLNHPFSSRACSASLTGTASGIEM